MDWMLTEKEKHDMALSLTEAEATFTDAVDWGARAAVRKVVEWVFTPCSDPTHGHHSSVQRRACVDCCLILKAAGEWA